MQIHLIAVGTRMPDWVSAGYAEYARRIPHQARLNLLEVAAGKRGKNADVARILDDEGKRLLAAVPKGARVIALERTGKAMSTRDIARKMESWMQSGADTALLVGGPEGLSDACLHAAHEVWSLSALVLPHPLVRVVLAEQLYRAWSINNNLPYHREG